MITSLVLLLGLALAACLVRKEFQAYKDNQKHLRQVVLGRENFGYKDPNKLLDPPQKP